MRLLRYSWYVCLITLVGLLLASTAFSQTPGRAGRKIALLVGVRVYRGDAGLGNLKYPENDVNALGELLQKQLGYKTVVVMTQGRGAFNAELLPTADNIEVNLKALLEDCKKGDTVLVALTGHGLQLPDGEREEAYFCPMDACIKEGKNLLPLGKVNKLLEGCKADVKLLLVDACRNDPTGKGAGVDRKGLAPLPAPRGVVALYSCSDGQQSFESDAFRHGIFLHYVIEGLKGKAANRRGEVTLDSLTDYLVDEVPTRVRTEISLRARQVPKRVNDFSGKLVLAAAAPPEERDAVNSIGMKLVRLPAGKFLVGSLKDEEGRLDHEGPRHEVEISRPFLMGAHPVTVGQFRAFVEATGYKTDAERTSTGYGFDGTTRRFAGPSAVYSWRHTGWRQTDAHPVVNVTWADAVAFCQWLSRKEGRTYTLPTEAEWEYACRAGTRSRFWSGQAGESLKGVANLADRDLRAEFDPRLTPFAEKGMTYADWNDGHPFTSPVGAYKANPWGLYDMHGNVWQWCADWHGEYPGGAVRDPRGPAEGKFRVLRGGSFGEPATRCRAAFRLGLDPEWRGVAAGFRVVLRGETRQ
jgi:formylglycine-generating enzyme required for sulfatase activity